MIAKHAKEIARQWAQEEATVLPGFQGALFHGSILRLPEDAILPTTSDVDILVVLRDEATPGRSGKFLFLDVLLEVSYLTQAQIQSAEQILSNYHLAGSFRMPGIIADPTGKLGELQAIVSQAYAKHSWVHKRCEDAKNNILNKFPVLNSPAPFHDQVMAWLFAAGVTTHVLLVAGLKNPTVRQRYLAARELLATYNRLDLYEMLLELLGCATMSSDQVEQHLAALAEAFDTAKTIIRTPYRFAADLTNTARPVAIDGSRELIERGYHREAIFWIVATYSRCQWVLHHDTSLEVQEKHSHGYRALLADLGIVTVADLQRRGEEIRSFLPTLGEAAEAIMAANPEIEPDGIDSLR